jgi:molybdopterin converting factor small subunit
MGCIKVRFGGPVALATGATEVCIDLAQSSEIALQALVEMLQRRYPSLTDELSREATEWGWPTAVALNGVAVEWDRMGEVILKDGDEVYFFKLVAGG